MQMQSTCPIDNNFISLEAIIAEAATDLSPTTNELLTRTPNSLRLWEYFVYLRLIINAFFHQLYQMFASARKVTSPLRKFICFHTYIWTCTFIYNSNLWHYKSKMQCFICQVCLASDVFLLFESSVPWAYSMLDGSSADTSCSFRWMSFVSISRLEWWAF